MTVLPLGSPYWLLIYDTWVHLEGVTPGSSRSVERPRSSFLTVGGRRYSQQARRGPRTWSMDLRFASAETLRLLEMATELDEVWLHDTAAAAENMLDPREGFGHTTPTYYEIDGFPLRVIEAGTVATVRFRKDVITRISAWASSSVSTGGALATITHAGGTTTLVQSSGSGLRRSEVWTAAPTNADATITVVTPHASGLQVVEGDSRPTWVAGQRTPCRVVVHDVERSLSLIRDGVGYSDASVTLEEVG